MCKSHIYMYRHSWRLRKFRIRGYLASQVPISCQQISSEESANVKQQSSCFQILQNKTSLGFRSSEMWRSAVCKWLPRCHRNVGSASRRPGPRKGRNYDPSKLRKILTQNHGVTSRRTRWGNVSSHTKLIYFSTALYIWKYNFRSLLRTVCSWCLNEINFLYLKFNYPVPLLASMLI